MNYDLFLVCAYKDYSKLPFVLEALTTHMQPENIYLCTPETFKDSKSLHFPIHYRTDQKVLKALPHKWRYRKNWVYQQFIKLFQDETQNDWYFVCDCDTILNQPLKIWEDDKPVQHYGWDQNNEPYYRFNKAMLGYERTLNHTALSDTGLYNKNLVTQMLGTMSLTVDSFLAKTYNIISKEVYPSEADLFFNWVEKVHPGLYTFKQLKTKMNAREGKDPFKQLWKEQDIRDLIKKMSKRDIDTFSLHSWIDRSHNRWER